mgnify:CR=1 FL=1
MTGADLVVGAPSSTWYTTGYGAIHAFYGLDGTEEDADDAAVRIRGTADRDDLGTSLLPLGDPDGDGAPSFAVGATGYDGGELEGGGVFFFEGGGL